MARPIVTVDNDFDGVFNFFKNKGIVSEKPTTALVNAARRMHCATYSLILWRFRLSSLPKHGRVFVEEIASDALQVLPQALTGYSKTTKLLTRGVIENCFRHIYFSDHPVEFWRMNREAKWYRKVDELFDYPLNHPKFLNIEKRFDAINRLKGLYDELSAGVHGRRVQDLEMRLSLDKIGFNQTAFEEILTLVERCAESSNFLLCIFHDEQVRRLQKEDRQIILRTLPKNARQVVAGLI